MRIPAANEYAEHKSKRRRIFVLTLFLTPLLLLLVFVGVTMGRPSKTSNDIFSITHDREKHLVAFATFSCSDYNDIYGKNYYSQLSTNWSAWSSTGVISARPALVNYLYNANAQDSYNLYLASLQSKGCSPLISGADSRSPSEAPTSTFTPATNSPNVGCNAAIGTQFIGIYNNQFMTALQQEQAQIDAWVNSQSTKADGVTSAFTSGMTSIELQLNSHAKFLMSQLLVAVSSVNC